MTTVSRAQYARLSRCARSDPRICLTKQRDVSATGSERAFIHLRGRQVSCRHTRPRATAVSGGEYVKLLVDRITERDTVVCIPERHRIEERLFVFVSELHFPGRAAVSGFIDS